MSIAMAFLLQNYLKKHALWGTNCKTCPAKKKFKITAKKLKMAAMILVFYNLGRDLFYN